MAQEAILEKVNGEVHISKSFDFMCSQLRNGRYRVKIERFTGDYWVYTILTIPEHDVIELPNRPLVHYKSYEEVLEAGIQEALKLI